MHSVQSVYFSGTNIHFINARYNVLYLNNTIIRHHGASNSVHVRGHMKRPKVERSVRQAPSTLLIAHLQMIASPPALLHEPSPTLASAKQPVDLKEAEVCTVFQRSFTATRIDVQCTGMHQVPHRVHSSIWCCELSPLPRR